MYLARVASSVAFVLEEIYEKGDLLYCKHDKQKKIIDDWHEAQRCN